jgi:hypothetical protein
VLDPHTLEEVFDPHWPIIRSFPTEKKHGTKTCLSLLVSQIIPCTLSCADPFRLKTSLGQGEDAVVAERLREILLG